MKKILNILLFFFTCTPGALSAQAAIKSQGEGYTQIPQEKVFVHYNNSLLFAGEYIYYKLYALNSTSSNPGVLSKVAYVELVGEDGSRVFRHKVKLENGTGQGDFFLPTGVPSGNYKLLGYTQWMLNGGEGNIFRGDLAILNPYRGDQGAVTPREDVEVMVAERSAAESVSQTRNGSNDLQLNLAKRNFSTRQQVILKLNGGAGSVEGNYSVSVRKAENIKSPAMLTAANFHRLYRDFDRGAATEVYLPELRGELLNGRIVPAGNTGEFSVQNKKVALSIPGEDYVVKVAGTNSRGEFFFNIDGEYSGETAVLEVIGTEKEHYQILLSEKAEVDYRALNFNKFYISPEMEEMIVERSVYNQIENAYYGVKPDTLMAGDSRRPFYELQPIMYDLDDYTRFPTLRETFIEIIKEAFVRNMNSQPTVRIRSLDNASAAGLPPLILVDGMVVQEHTAFLDIPAVEIQRIEIIRHNYYLGPQLFQGIIDVKTVSGNFPERYSPATITTIELEKPQPRKKYFKQQYDSNSNGNIPDFRYQLLWQPAVPFTGNETILEFYTSDVKGNFEIHVEGFGRNGIPVSLRAEIKVE